jgi:acetyltransferase
VAETEDDQGERSLMGVVRLSKLHAMNEARLSILIGDPYQGMGLGGELVQRVIEVAKQEKVARISATLTTDNQVMQHIFRKAGFAVEPAEQEGLLVASLAL